MIRSSFIWTPACTPWPLKSGVDFSYTAPSIPMKHLMTAVALATSFALPAWAQNIAIVNGKPVPVSQMNAFVQQLEKSGRTVDDALRAQIKEHLIVREIFAQEAERRGLKSSPDYRIQVEFSNKDILIRELFADFERKNPVTEAEVKAEYDKFSAANAGQEYRARHILVETEAQAKALIASIQQGAKFEDVAKKESKDPGSGANGGDLDWASASTFVPEFSEAMVKLGKGQMTTTPVKSQFGWHIIRVDDTRPATLPSMAELKPEIEKQLKQQKLAQFQENLRDKAKVK
jgi:peptidyl-prolyl cis-trans isomerase C